MRDAERPHCGEETLERIGPLGQALPAIRIGRIEHESAQVRRKLARIDHRGGALADAEQEAADFGAGVGADLGHEHDRAIARKDRRLLGDPVVAAHGRHRQGKAQFDAEQVRPGTGRIDDDARFKAPPVAQLDPGHPRVGMQHVADVGVPHQAHPAANASLQVGRGEQVGVDVAVLREEHGAVAGLPSQPGRTRLHLGTARSLAADPEGGCGLGALRQGLGPLPGHYMKRTGVVTPEMLAFRLERLHGEEGFPGERDEHRVVADLRHQRRRSTGRSACRVSTLQNRHPMPLPLAGERPGDGRTEDAGADDQDVARAVQVGTHPAPSTMPASRSVSPTAATTFSMSAPPSAPMQPTRKVSTRVSLPG